MSLAAAIRYYRARERERANVGMASVVTAADFMTGLSPMAAEAYDRKGAMVEAFAREDGETFAAFRERVREAAHTLPGAMRVESSADSHKGRQRSFVARLKAFPETL